MEREAIRQEIAQHEATRSFWSKVNANFPLAAGHPELGQSLLAKYAAEIGPMSIEEGVEFLGEKIVAEVKRRRRQDHIRQEAAVYGGGGDGPVHGHQVNSLTGATIMPGLDTMESDAAPSLGEVIRNRRAQRGVGQQRWRNNKGDRREHGRF